MAEAAGLALTVGHHGVSATRSMLTREAKKRIGQRRAALLGGEAHLADIAEALEKKHSKKRMTPIGSVDWSLTTCPLSSVAWNKLSKEARMNLVAADLTNKFELMIETIKDEWTVDQVLASGIGSITGLTPACRLSQEGLEQSLKMIVTTSTPQKHTELIRRYPMHGGYLEVVDPWITRSVQDKLSRKGELGFVQEVLKGSIDSWLFKVDEHSATAMDFHIGTGDLVPGVFTQDVLSWGIDNDDAKRYARLMGQGMKSVAFLMMLERGCDTYLISSGRKVVYENLVFEKIQVIWCGGDISAIIMSGSSGCRIRVSGTAHAKATGNTAFNLMALGMQHEAYWTRHHPDPSPLILEAFMYYDPDPSILKRLSESPTYESYAFAETALFDFRELPNRMRAILRQSERGILVYRLIDAVCDYLRNGRLDLAKVSDEQLQSRAFEFSAITEQIDLPADDVIVSLLTTTEALIEATTREELNCNVMEEMETSIASQGHCSDLEFDRLADNLKRVVVRKSIDGCVASSAVTSNIVISMSVGTLTSRAGVSKLKPSDMMDIAYCGTVFYKDGKVHTSRRLFRKIRDCLRRDGLAAVEVYVEEGVRRLISMSEDVKFTEYSDCIEKLMFLSIGKVAKPNVVRFVLLEADRCGLMDKCSRQYSWRSKPSMHEDGNGKSASLPLEGCEFFGGEEGVVKVSAGETMRYMRMSETRYQFLKREPDSVGEATEQVMRAGTWLI